MIIIDDMISSGESVLEVAAELKKRKARRIFIFSTFGIFTNGLRQFDKAYEVWCGVVEELERRGFEAELDFPRSLAKKCKEKMEKVDIR